jgi:hypothetical protein
MSIYIPYLPYALIIGAIASKSLIRQTLSNINPRFVYFILLTLLIMILPLILAGIKDPEIFKTLLGIPQNFPTPFEIMKNVGSSLGEVFWSSKEYWSLRLGTLPLLDLFTAVMVALGFYHLDQEISRTLARFVIIGFGVLLVIIGLKPSPLNSIVLLPFVYTLAAAGVVMLLSQWYEIFPRNPVARITALVPTLLLFMSVIWYHNQRYFVAWPSTPEVVAEFPALARSLQTELSQIDRSQTSIILTTVQEHDMAAIVANYYPKAQLTTVESSIIGQPNILITNASYQQLSDEVRQQVQNKLRPIITESRAEPVAIWVNTNSSTDTIE